MNFFDKLKEMGEQRTTRELEQAVEDLGMTWQDRQATRQVLDQRRQGEE